MAGHIVAIIGGKGGVGKSQFAVNLAFAQSLETRQKTLLLDFDQRACGDLELISGMKSKKNLLDLSKFTGAFDPKTILQFVSPHPAGVNLIGLPTDPSEAMGVDPEGMGRFLKTVVNMYPLTIIDCGSELNDLAAKGLEFATCIFLVTTPDIIALNQTKRLYSDLTTMMFPKEMLQIIVNGQQKGNPVTNEVIGKSIGKPIFSSIAKDDQTCVLALNQRKPAVVVARNALYSNSVIEVVRRASQKNLYRQLEQLNKNLNLKGSSEKEMDKRERDAWTSLKARIHRALVDEMDLKNEKNGDDPKANLVLKEKAKKVIVDLLNKEHTKGILNNREDMNNIVKEILDEALGLGPLEDLLADPECSEIMVVGAEKIYFERGGKIRRSEITFTNEGQVRNVIERIVAPIGRRIDEKTPYVDARLKDGSRVHAIIPPSALDGSVITIRKFPVERLTYKDLIRFGSLTENMADFLRIAVESHRNIVVSGGTGSGKTTLINILGSFIPANERIITCEDSAELNLPQEHIVRLETRPPNLEGTGEIDIRLLVKQTLRMRPDRIIVGECRGGETLDMLQAMGTGHDGSLTTVHSNSPRECIGRLETLVQYAGAGLSAKAINQMIANSVHLIVQAKRLDDGQRKITQITEIQGMQGDTVTSQEVFEFVQSGMDTKGKIIGEHQASGFTPKFIEILAAKGYKIRRGMFANTPTPARPSEKSSAPKKKDPGK